MGSRLHFRYYSYHYAPFTSYFSNVENVSVQYNTNSKPLKSLEHLIAIFPPHYANYPPRKWQQLMVDKNSPISEFYPINFDIDLNGKRQEWQGIILLPFVDEKRLHEALESVYLTLTPDEEKRNKSDYDHLLIHSTHSCYEQVLNE
ncbi:unnamed protein product [Didymodactylos carnosus]|uniref:Xrn1 helical domain-containing protein n=1 Tax=Didymodactylos carnosus TaxID=1234261 RepID=A0A815DFU2_9BILA|nr:unnamed protein product [Didymodactylos carnosus]CAF1406034.1 unnamed protein product [Didymodactylos carnosus]CAF4111783.1 unnamed protein product [Didymodactylos carnosus]CAF4211543.1 unnamed protein product [Didymodactylos carnosus]